MAKLIGYARVSTRQQSADRRETGLLTAGVRRNDLHVNHGISGARAFRPRFDQALGTLGALELGALLSSRLSIGSDDRRRTCSTSSASSATAVSALRVLNLGGGCRHIDPDGVDAVHDDGRPCRWSTRSNASGSSIRSASVVPQVGISVADLSGLLTVRSATLFAS